MKNTDTLKKNYEFKRILNKGKYCTGNYIECFFQRNNKKINLIGIAISSKIAKATKRNRIKRLIRENYRLLEDKLESGFSIVFLWKKHKDINKASFYNIKTDMEQILKEMEIYIDKENTN